MDHQVDPAHAPATGAPVAAPELPAVWLDPRPPVAAGFVGWIIAIIIALIVDGTGSAILPICYGGLGAGALGVSIYLVQRAAARRGTRGAQPGLV